MAEVKPALAFGSAFAPDSDLVPALASALASAADALPVTFWDLALRLLPLPACCVFEQSEGTFSSERKRMMVGFIHEQISGLV